MDSRSRLVESRSPRVSSWSPLSGLVESTSGLAESIHGLTESLNFPFWSVVHAPALARMREGALRNPAPRSAKRERGARGAADLPAAEAAGTTPANSQQKRDTPTPVAAASAAALSIPTDTPRSRCAESGAELCRAPPRATEIFCKNLLLRSGQATDQPARRKRSDGVAKTFFLPRPSLRSAPKAPFSAPRHPPRRERNVP